MSLEQGTTTHWSDGCVLESFLHLREQVTPFTNFLYSVSGTTDLQQSRLELSEIVAATPFPSFPRCCLPPKPTSSSLEIMSALVIICHIRSCPSQALLTEGLEICNRVLSLLPATLHSQSFWKFSSFNFLACCGGQTPEQCRLSFPVPDRFLWTVVSPGLGKNHACSCLLLSPRPELSTSCEHHVKREHRQLQEKKQGFVGTVQSKFVLRKETLLQSKESKEHQLCSPHRRTSHWVVENSLAPLSTHFSVIDMQSSAWVSHFPTRWWFAGTRYVQVCTSHRMGKGKPRLWDSFQVRISSLLFLSRFQRF